MSDIKSTIRIEDGFTEPLRNLTKETINATSAVVDLKDSIQEAADTLDLKKIAIKSVEHAALNSIDRVKNLLIKNTNLARDSVVHFSNVVKKRALDSVKDYLTLRKELKLTREIEAATAKHTFETMKLSADIEKAVTDQKLKQLKEAKLLKEIEDAATQKKLKGALLEENITKEIEKAVAQKELMKGLEEELASKKILDATREKNLSKEIESSAKKAAIKKRFGMIKDELRIIGEVLKNRFVKLGNRLQKGLRTLPSTLKSLPEKLSSIDLKKFAQNLFNSTKTGIKNGFNWLKNSEGVSIIRDFGKDFSKSFTHSVLGGIIEKAASSLGNKIKEKFIIAGKALIETINNSLDDLNLTDKLTSMYGEAGLGVRDRAYKLANHLGESSLMVGELSARASYQGIGTKDFERIMFFADKIGKLSLGETTESAANNLIQNIKSSHDASSMAQMLGGGERMERRLRYAGFERALNRGDLNRALDIAEKIADQAGLTNEKYQSATRTMSQNFKKIENFVSNLKHRLAELYSQQFEPIVQKISDLIENKNFQRVLRVVEEGVKKVGQFINWLMEGLIDNIHFIGIFLGVGLIAKVLLIAKNIGGIVGMLGFTKGILFWIGDHVVAFLGKLGLVNASLGFSGVLGKLKKITAEQLKQLAIEKAKSLIKPAKIGLGVGAGIAAVTAIGYGVYKAKGGEKDFGEFVDGLIGAIWQGLIDLQSWIPTYFNNCLVEFNYGIIEPIKLGFWRVLGDIQNWIQEKIGWLNLKLADLFDWLAEKAKSISELFNFSINIGGEGINLNPISSLFEKVSDSWHDSAKLVREKDEDNKRIVDKNGNVKILEGYAFKWGKQANDRYEELKKYREMHDMGSRKMEYANILKSMSKGFEKGTNGVIDSIIKNTRIALGIKENTGETKTNTGELVKMGEQEEELRWLKAFSDRQIMSQYNNSTSTVLNTTFNGASEQLQRHSVDRLGRRARPSKAAAI